MLSSNVLFQIFKCVKWHLFKITTFSYPQINFTFKVQGWPFKIQVTASERISLQSLHPDLSVLSFFKLDMWQWGKHIPFITYSCPEDEQSCTPQAVSLPVPWVSAQPLSDGELTPFPSVKPFLLFPDRCSQLMHCELALNSQSTQAFFFQITSFCRHLNGCCIFFFPSVPPDCPSSSCQPPETLLILRDMILHFKLNLSSIFVRPTVLRGNHSAWMHYSIWGSTMR